METANQKDEDLGVGLSRTQGPRTGRRIPVKDGVGDARQG